MTAPEADGSPTAHDERRVRGLEMMSRVYGFDVAEAHGDFMATTVDHLFGDIWSRPGLTLRDRRLLLLGLLAGQHLNDVLDLQIPAALANAEITPDELREIVLFLTHYTGWPQGARLNSQAETHIARHEKAARKKDAQG
ncbi:carboxymuconolactone decarboxylase family protein [Actinocorallia sp. A-T 12471]|uniref:carboxymuconolactone decarboxylase family protein n=1 Tax=Actinocorallia sp. A-T 12471 TaxID=3089813 RepID=UPI0029CDF66A|nr:carboxymuconolactone decarboxylase family protein [Actinocorallia sp. A-T 12471]MDX6741985.1 carboxymuconolactone decarboxylase family protein [Actinocorallia sp. A-T 12471]